MGWITKRRLLTGRGIATGNTRKGRRWAPLRKIVGTKTVAADKPWLPDRQYELLKCGHLGKNLISIGASGLFGAQPANSRRCMQCFKQLHILH